MGTLNLGIVAHVDAGKTSLTERLLFAAGVITELGSVDGGDTQTDSLELERRRGITIRSAVASFRRHGVAVNVIDTPGHHDFVAEVERALAVLDGAILVVSAVEGVQAHTRLLMRTLRRLGIPTLIFVNKIDRVGARSDQLVTELAGKLEVTAVPLQRVLGLGTVCATVQPYTEDELGDWIDALTEHDDGLASAYLDDAVVLAGRRLRRSLERQSRAGLLHPVFFGSAITGAGVHELMDGLTRLLPLSGTVHPEAATDGRSGPGEPARGTVFKIDRDESGQRIAYLRMFSGVVRVREPVALPGQRSAKITGLRRFAEGASRPERELRAGEIGTVTGLGPVAIGDWVGAPSGRAGRPAFDPPTLEAVIRARTAAGRGPLHHALSELAEQDPLIGLRRDDDGDLLVSLYGEVQQQVLESMLEADYGLSVEIASSRTICIERVAGTGSAAEFIYDPDNPFLATVGLRIEPAPAGQGIGFGLEVELGAMPLAFFTAVEVTIREQLQQGLHGWQVPDATVILTHSGYAPRQSHAHARFDKSMSSTGADFRGLTPLVVMRALREAGTTVCEPIHRFRLELPADLLGSVLPVLAHHRAVPLTPSVGAVWCVLEGDVPAEAVHRLQQVLPGLTRGEGVLETRFDRYAPVLGAVPQRPRRRTDALRRKDYLLQVLRRVAAGQPS